MNVLGLESSKAKNYSANTALPTCSENMAKLLRQKSVEEACFTPRNAPKIKIGNGTHVEKPDVNTTSGCLDNPGRVSTGKLQPP